MNSRKIPRFKIKLNIASIVFIVVLVYIFIRMLMSLGESTISITDVSKGYIVENSYYTGVILRDEELVKASNTGYINYYVAPNKKVAKDEKICLLSEEPLEISEADSSNVDYNAIKNVLATYSDTNEVHYDTIYTLKYELQNQLDTKLNEKITADNSLTAAGSVMTAEKSGIISNIYDNYMNLTEDDINSDIILRSGYAKSNVPSNSRVGAGEVAYRLVNSVNWSIIVKLGDDMYERLQDRTYVKIRFRRDDVNTYANCTLFDKDDEHYAKLDLRKYMIKYINDRFVDIEIINTSESGLKIPTQAIVEKEFFAIPLDYIVRDENSGATSVILKKGNSADNFSVSIYKEDDNYAYVDMTGLSAGDILADPSGGEDTKVSYSAFLNGVYCVNKGYAAFRQINVLYKTDTYTIVSENTKYGLSLYDRIVINAENVKEGEIIDKFTGDN